MGRFRREYLLPFAPLSVNNAYGARCIKAGSRYLPSRFLDSRYRHYKDVIKERIIITNLIEGDVPPLRFVGMDFTFIFERSSFWEKTTGNVKKKDVSNLFKLLEDAFAEEMGLDDRNNLCVFGRKYCVDDGTLSVEPVCFGKDKRGKDKKPPTTDRAIIQVVVTEMLEEDIPWLGNVLTTPG